MDSTAYQFPAPAIIIFNVREMHISVSFAISFIHFTMVGISKFCPKMIRSFFIQNMIQCTNKNIMEVWICLKFVVFEQKLLHFSQFHTDSEGKMHYKFWTKFEKSHHSYLRLVSSISFVISFINFELISTKCRYDILNYLFFATIKLVSFFPNNATKRFLPKQ